MDLLFRRKYTYTVNKSFEDILDDFSKISDSSWWDFSKNISGELNEDNTFLFFHKWTFGFINGLFGNKFVYLKGQISDRGEKTIITTQITPNLGLVLLHSLLAGQFIIELFNVMTTNATEREFFFIFIYPIFGPIILGIVFLMTNGLKSTFENILQIHPDQSYNKK